MAEVLRDLMVRGSVTEEEVASGTGVATVNDFVTEY